MRIRPPAVRPGAALVEMAVVTPVLFMLILGIIEFGRLFMVSQVAVNASREGARYAVQADQTNSVVDLYTRDYLAATGVPSSAVTALTFEKQAANGTWSTVSDLTTVAGGTPVRVTIQIDFLKVSYLPSGIFVGSGSHVQGVTVMRKE